jgi:uncharacterized integral membrane protein (TIGR00697 family)
MKSKTLAQSSQRQPYKHLDFVMAAFVTVLLCSNLIGASKIVTVAGFTFGAGIFFFPLSYIFGDILTEVYGYAKSRRVVWAGFAALFFASFMSWVIIKMPPAGAYKNQAALEAIFGGTPRIFLASLLAFFCGEFTNSFVLAKMKIWTQGRMLWARTIGSTLAGEGVDSIIFYPLAFWDVPLRGLQAIFDFFGFGFQFDIGSAWGWQTVQSVMIANYILKTAWEVVMTPVTYRIVAWLKRVENEDFFDTKTNFTPFSLKN